MKYKQKTNLTLDERRQKREFLKNSKHVGYEIYELPVELEAEFRADPEGAAEKYIDGYAAN